MDIRQLQYFIRVFEERSFSRAAEKANVVQPALSMQIRRLEEELSCTLFDRTARGIDPTVSGRRLYELALPIVRSMAEARQEIIELAGGSRISGAIHIGCPPSVNRGVMGAVLARYAEAYPNVAVTITEAYSNALTAYVHEGTLDAALGGRPTEGSGLSYRLAYQDRLVLVAGRPLNGPSLSPVRLDTLQDLKLILPSRRNLLGSTIFDFIDNGQLKPHRTLNIDGVVATLELARSSEWAAIFPVVAMLQDVDRGDLFLYPIVAPHMGFALYMVHDPRRPPPAAVRAFTDMLESELRTVDPVRERFFSSDGTLGA